jgi:hypothetical protein
VAIFSSLEQLWYWWMAAFLLGWYWAAMRVFNAPNWSKGASRT